MEKAMTHKTKSGLDLVDFPCKLYGPFCLAMYTRNFVSASCFMCDTNNCFHSSSNVYFITKGTKNKYQKIGIRYFFQETIGFCSHTIIVSCISSKKSLIFCGLFKLKL